MNMKMYSSLRSFLSPVFWLNIFKRKRHTIELIPAPDGKGGLIARRVLSPAELKRSISSWYDENKEVIENNKSERVDFALCGLCGGRVPHNSAICNSCFERNKCIDEQLRSEYSELSGEDISKLLSEDTEKLETDVEKYITGEIKASVDKVVEEAIAEHVTKCTQKKPKARGVYCFNCKLYARKESMCVHGPTSHFNWCPDFERIAKKEKFWRLERG